MTKHKSQILGTFNSTKLEELLFKSTKNVAQEVVSILINFKPSTDTQDKIGLLTEIEL